MRRIGLFGGTFNPVHRGHIELARVLVEKDLVDEVWMVLSPQNPLKNHKEGATDSDRKEMLTLACREYSYLKPCFEEFDMPRPSYTINTLRRLADKYPDCQFKQIIGSDNWLIFDQWREHDAILRDFGVIVYPRPGYPSKDAIDAPLSNISSTLFRETHNPELLPEAVVDYITKNNLYAVIQ